MPETDIGQITTTSNTQEDFSVETATTDGATDQKETEYMNSEWTQQFGYYKKIPELTAVIDAKATWTVGKGYISDPTTNFQIGLITGNGVDTFNSILENMIRTYQIGGDSYAEIMRNPNDLIINLKPLTPENIKIVANRKGVIIRYEQVDRNPKKKPKTFKPEEILHLSRNRVADEIHGQSMIDVLTTIILMKNEAMADYQKVMHRNVFPRFIFHVDTDDATQIATIKTQLASMMKEQEHMVVPKGAVVPELNAVAPNATLNPLTWLNYLDDKFYEAAGVPKIILGGAGGITEAAVKIAYLAFEQTIEEEQLYIEETISKQLGYQIELEFPASLENELISDKKKDVTKGASQPNDTEAGAGA